MANTNSTAPVFTQSHITEFWSYVNVGDPIECWLWQRGKSAAGYGRFIIEGRQYYTHIIARFIATGEWPVKLNTCHNCPTGDNPACCNPSHLFLGTQSENLADMWRKERGKKGDKHYARNTPEKLARGEQHGQSRLTEDQVREIRLMYATGLHSQSSLAKLFGVSQMSISKICRRETWKHI